MSDRDAILERVRGAIGGVAAPGTEPREYPTVGRLSAEARTALFCERVGDYRVDVRRLAADQVAAVAGAASATLGLARLVVPEGLPAEWLPAGVEIVVDHALSPHALDEIGAVMTGCTVAIAETGTLILTAAPGEGRRAITLVPDVHICVVREDQILELVPEAIAALDPTRPITLISGPSATSDIELSRVEGVHGPRTVLVLVVA